MTLISKVNKWLAANGYAAKLYRHPAGYYYFSGSLHYVPSLYCFNLGLSYTFDEIIEHIIDAEQYYKMLS